MAICPKELRYEKLKWKKAKLLLDKLLNKYIDDTTK